MHISINHRTLYHYLIYKNVVKLTLIDGDTGNALTICLDNDKTMKLNELSNYPVRKLHGSLHPPDGVTT